MLLIKNTILFKLIIITLLFFPKNLFGQLKFTNIPLSINPANTGRFENNVRLNLTKKNTTIASNRVNEANYISSDIRLNNKKNEKDFWGIGAAFENDYDNNGGFKNSSLSLSLSFTKDLSENSSHTVSVGFKGSLIQKILQPRLLIFESDIILFSGLGYNIDNIINHFKLDTNFGRKLGNSYLSTNNVDIYYNFGISYKIINQ